MPKENKKEKPRMSYCGFFVAENEKYGIKKTQKNRDGFIVKGIVGVIGFLPEKISEAEAREKLLAASQMIGIKDPVERKFEFISDLPKEASLAITESSTGQEIYNLYIISRGYYFLATTPPPPIKSTPADAQVVEDFSYAIKDIREK